MNDTQRSVSFGVGVTDPFFSSAVASARLLFNAATNPLAALTGLTHGEGGPPSAPKSRQPRKQEAAPADLFEECHHGHGGQADASVHRDAPHATCIRTIADNTEDRP